MNAFATLCVKLADRFQAKERPGARSAADALRAASLTDPMATPANVPQEQLTRAAALPGALPEAQDAARCAPILCWSHWAEDKLDDDVSGGLWTAELVGPDGAVSDKSVRVGLLYSDPHVDYPLSSHAGEETYLVLAGTAEWRLVDTDYAAQPPGALVHHPSWKPHGRRTLSEPFLGAWRWSGDLDLSKFKLEAA